MINLHAVILIKMIVSKCGNFDKSIINEILTNHKKKIVSIFKIKTNMCIKSIICPCFGLRSFIYPRTTNEKQGENKNKWKIYWNYPSEGTT